MIGSEQLYRRFTDCVLLIDHTPLFCFVLLSRMVIPGLTYTRLITGVRSCSILH